MPKPRNHARELLDWQGRGQVIPIDGSTPDGQYIARLNVARNSILYYFNGEIDPFFTQARIFYEMVYSGSKHIVVITPTGYGKTTFFAMIALVLASIRRESVSVVAPTTKKANLIVASAIELLRSANENITSGLLESKDKIEKLSISLTKGGLQWNHGGGIKVVSASETTKNSDIKGGDAIGEGATVYLVDESALISNRNYAVALRRTADNPDDIALIGEISNPHQDGHFREDIEGDDPDITKIRINIDDALAEGRYTQAQVEKAIKLMGGKNTREYKIFYECEFQDGDAKTQLFYGAMPIMLDTTPPLRDFDKLFAGIDFAYNGSDDFRVSIGGENKDGFTLLTTEKHNGQGNIIGQIDTIVTKIVAKLRLLRVRAIAMDIGGNGSALLEAFSHVELGELEVYPVNFASKPTEQRVEAGLWQAKNAQNKRAEIHLDMVDYGAKGQLFVVADQFRDLEKQMLATEYTMPLGKYALVAKNKIVEKVGHSPDELDSVALAVHAKNLYDISVPTISTYLDPIL